MVDSQTASLAHHSTWNAGEPDLTVTIWDTASTGVSLPEACRPADGDPQVLASYHVGNFGLSLLEPASATAGYWLPDAAPTPNHDRGTPLRVILNWWLGLRGIQLVHCSGVAVAGAAALIVGPGGSGKSTSSLACLLAGVGFIGDDYCAVDMSSQPPAVRNLYSVAKLAPESLARLPALRRHVINPDSLEDGKYLLSLGTVFAHQIVEMAPLRAILVPHLADGAETRFTPARPLAALTALAPSTLIQAPARADSLARMRDLVAAVPCFDVALSGDLTEVPAAIRRFLSNLSPGGEA